MTDLTPTQTLDDELNMQNLEAELAAIPLDEVTRAIKDIADGRPVIVVDDADRENEGDIVFAASKATPELLAFTIRYGRGLICVPMLGPDLDRRNVPQMTSENQEHHGTAFTISVDAERRHHHRHLGGRPGEDHPAPRQPRQHPGRPGPPRSRVPAQVRRGRRAAQARPHRGRRRPGRAGRAAAGHSRPPALSGYLRLPHKNSA